MAQCGVPTAAWPFACGDVDLNNGLHWDNTTNKFWVEPGMSTQVPARAWIGSGASANIDAASPNGNGLYWDAAKCKVWARPESITNHPMVQVVPVVAPDIAGYWQFQTSPYEGRHCVWWSPAYNALGQRVDFNMITASNPVNHATIANDSPVARKVRIDVKYPRVQDYVTLQSPWVQITGQTFFQIFPTAAPPPVALSVKPSMTVTHVPFATAYQTVTNNVNALGYPFVANYGGDLMGSGWVTPTATIFDLDGGGAGLVAGITELGTTTGFITLNPAESVRVTFGLRGTTGFASALLPSGFPDPPWVASYSSLFQGSFGFTMLTLI